MAFEVLEGIRDRSEVPVDPDQLAAEAVNRAEKYSNPLVVDEAIAYHEASGIPVPGDMRHAAAILDARCRSGDALRWLPTPVEGEASMTDPQRWAARMHRTARWLEAIEDGTGHAVYVTAPARDEESELERFFDSLKRVVKYPIIAVIIADDKSRDRTIDKILAEDGNVAYAWGLGIGSAREAARRQVERHRMTAAHRTIIMTTDCDVVVPPGYTDRAVDYFADPVHQDKYVLNGSVEYDIDWPDMPYLSNGQLVIPGNRDGRYDNLITTDELNMLRTYMDPGSGPTRLKIKGFDGYGLLTNNQSQTACFRELGYDIRHFIVGERFRMLAGPNNFERLSRDEILPIPYHYRPGRLREQHDKSVFIQSFVDFDEIGGSLSSDKDQPGVLASSRAIVGIDNHTPGTVDVLTNEQLLINRGRNGGAKPLRDPESLDQLDSAAETIAFLQRYVYALRSDQSVHQYYASVEEARAVADACQHHAPGTHELRVARRPQGLRQIAGYYALIGSS